MSKWLIIIVLIAALTGWVLWYVSKNNVKPISEQLDLKSGSTNIDWIVNTTNYCDGALWSCKNYSSSSSSSSWWGWWSGWGWWGK